MYCARNTKKTVAIMIGGDMNRHLGSNNLTCIL